MASTKSDVNLGCFTLQALELQHSRYSEGVPSLARPLPWQSSLALLFNMPTVGPITWRAICKQKAPKPQTLQMPSRTPTGSHPRAWKIKSLFSTLTWRALSTTSSGFHSCCCRGILEANPPHQQQCAPFTKYCNYYILFQPMPQSQGVLETVEWILGEDQEKPPSSSSSKAEQILKNI